LSGAPGSASSAESCPLGPIFFGLLVAVGIWRGKL
jgi:hypothetical protein